MKFGIVVLPGSNCDHDALHVTRDVLGAEVDVLWHKETDLRGADCVIISLVQGAPDDEDIIWGIPLADHVAQIDGG